MVSRIAPSHPCGLDVQFMRLRLLVHTRVGLAVRTLLVASVACTAVTVFGQTIPTAAEVTRGGTSSSTTGEPALVLSPFEVREDEERGYLATSAQSGTRLRTELKDIAAAVSVVTKDF